MPVELTQCFRFFEGAEGSSQKRLQLVRPFAATAVLARDERSDGFGLPSEDSMLPIEGKVEGIHLQHLRQLPLDPLLAAGKREKFACCWTVEQAQEDPVQL